MVGLKINKQKMAILAKRENWKIKQDLKLRKR